ncbi:MAG TPA: PepSY-associated TM helix domain-containing protein [Bryobacteraceae bacterium]|jgi:uncharacterized iron-regulated membrane protein
MRKLLLNLHLYIALIAGVFVLILGLTGSIMAFEPEIDHLFHRHLTYVTPQAQARSLVDLGAIVTRAFPDEPIRGYGVSSSPDMSYQVATRKRMVYLNQYTGEILGSMTEADKVAAFQGMVHQLHLRLLIRNKADTGGLIESCAGLAIIFLSLSGLYLWWPLKRFKVAGGRRFWFDLHNVVGIISLMFLLILATTGCVIGFDHTTTPLFFKMTGSSMPPPPPRKSAPHASDAKPISPDQAYEIARTALPGTAPFAIDVPPPNGVYFIRSRYPEDLTPGGRSQVVIDQYSGQVLYAMGSRSAPAGVRMVISNRAIHTGDIFGIPSKIVMSFASLAIVLQLVTGLVLWWRRRYQ